jgi:hypothetical protein
MLFGDLILAEITWYLINITPKRDLFILNLVHRHQIVYYKQRYKNLIDPKWRAHIIFFSFWGCSCSNSHSVRINSKDIWSDTVKVIHPSLFLVMTATGRLPGMNQPRTGNGNIQRF